MATPQQNETSGTTLAEVDRNFQLMGCLGHGGFGSVFLAKKRSGRRVALKVMRLELDDDDDDVHAGFTRELDAVLKLDCTANENNNKDMGIVFFKDWFTGPNFCCIVMNYADGGTLAQEISQKGNNNEQPYTERRIAWYALQLCEALAHAHSRGVYHHDVKSVNVLIDRTGGGRLLLADFGSAVSPGEDSQHFTEIYASPELQTAHENDNFSGLEPEKVDAFGLGCILFEMLCCKKLIDFEGEQTLGQFLKDKPSADLALHGPHVRLPWLENGGVTPPGQVGYSEALGSVVKTLLDPNPATRATPSALQKPLRQDPQSPLLQDFLIAAQPPTPGAPVTIDNIQLGMFVQRGKDWDDGEADGGVGSVGAVVRLDPDAGYTEVTFPSRDHTEPKSMCCRIGAGNRFELQVGPTPLPDFYKQSQDQIGSGLLNGADASQYHVGFMMNGGCQVVGINQNQNKIVITPMQKIHVPALPFTLPVEPVSVGPAHPRKPKPVPDSWNLELGLLAPVSDAQLVLELFYSDDMDIQTQDIVSILRVQSVEMWNSYAKCCEEVASKNWGIVNEQRLFHGTREHAPEALLQTPNEFYKTCATATGNVFNIVFSDQPSFGDRYCHRLPDGSKQILLSRVALGRIDDQWQENPPPRPPHTVEYHSVRKAGHLSSTVLSVLNPCQAYPEYIITYKTQQLPGRRVVRARRPRGSRNSRPVPARPQQSASPPSANSSSPAIPTTSTTAATTVTSPPVMARPSAPISTPNSTTSTTPSKDKMCVVCMERPVSMILIPCGHPCLCGVCATKQGLMKLKRKCPECRQPFRMASKFYGRVVED